MTQKQIDELATVVGNTIRAAITPIHVRLAALEGVPFPKPNSGDPWRRGVSYRPGDVCRFSGSTWVCLTAHEAIRPATDFANWLLLLKRPEDAR